MCYRYAVLPIVRFVTNNWQALCRSILKDVYSHLCLNDVTVSRALVDSGPKPFVPRGQTQQGGLHDMVNDMLIETRVELVAGRLSCTEWMRPKAMRGGLRNARR